jgi:pyruvate dehydrogenase E2 component (dihydrolipoyllysine-residue acetyltransferase)
MSVEVVLPALGESVTEGTVTQWLKQVGDNVSVDEPLLEVSTDKVDTEIPSPAAGVLLEIKAAQDETIEVGALLAVIGDAAEGTSESGEDAAPTEDKAEQPVPTDEQEPATQQEEQSPAADDGGGGSSTPVTLPALGESVSEGTVTQWLKQVGDQVAVDEALLEVSTDKVDTEIPSPVAGTLLEIKVAEDETVEIGAELAVIGDKGAAPRAAEEPEPKEEVKAQPEPEEEAKAEPEPEEAKAEPQPDEQAPTLTPAVTGSQADTTSAVSGGSYVTPLVRKLAARHDVDLANLKGTGVGGRVRKQDVLEAARTKEEAAEEAAEPAPATAETVAAPTPSPLRGKTEKLSRLRKVIATRMVESLQTSAQLTTVVEVDVTAIARLRDRVKTPFAEREGVKLSFLPFFAKAIVDSLKIYPQLNASINTETDEVTYYDAEHLGVAVDTERGLLVPVIKDAGDLSIAGLARKIADLAARTRDNKITPDELSGGTFTLTNTGSRGALFDTPIINQPQVGILGTGTVVKRPVVIDDPNLGETIAVRHMVYLALTYDHRLVDGADAARFLTTIKQRLEEANFESELGF